MKVTALACAAPGDVAVPPELEGVVYVDDLCRRPDELSDSIDGSDRLVMIVHPARVSLAQMQQRVRAAGVDPLGVQYVSAEAIAGDARRATVLLGGAVARAAAYEESSPEHARATFGGRQSRREMISLPKPHYESVPLIDEGICAAGTGCRACVTECPQGAYHWSRGKVRFDRDACVTCGRCVTACPTGAISNPTLSNRALLDQITALVACAGPDPLGIAFVCAQRSQHISSAEWAEVEVQCTGMVPATWPLAALLLGAAAAAVVPCSASGCSLGSEERAADAVSIAGGLLAASGLERAAVSGEPGPLTASLGPVALEDPFGTTGPLEVMLALQSIATADQPIAVTGSMAYRGIVTIETAACTLCLTCAETCPTGALSHTAGTGHVELTFDAALCTGCSQCVPVCPEIERGAIRVDRRIDVAALQGGRQTLAESPTAQCELCGAPVASAAMLARISHLLGDEHTAAMDYLERRCMDCRGAS